MLIFEHLVQISGLLDPLSDSLTRKQLWRGLVLRAEQPELFIDGLDACRILSCTRYVFRRELRYGKTLMCDWVTLMPEQAVRYEIVATAVHVGGVLTMSIEQPDELQLFLRFKYESTLPNIDDDELHHLLEIVKAVYRQEDINTAYLICKYARGAR